MDGKQIKYTNECASKTFKREIDGTKEVDIHNFDIWGVYKLEGKKYVPLDANFAEYLVKGKFSNDFIKNEETKQKLFEFRIHKIIFENQEANIIEFYDVSQAHRCDLPQLGGKCDSSILLGNFSSELKYPVGLLFESLSQLSRYISSEGKLILEKAVNSSKLIEHYLRETMVTKVNNTGRITLKLAMTLWY